MCDSPLAVYTWLSPNHSGERTKPIDRITPHCVVGQAAIETIGRIFSVQTRKASSNYGIGTDGRIGMFVHENCRSWCSSSAANDQRAVTIECASDAEHPYAMNDRVYASLVNLCTDICARNHKTKLLWIPGKTAALAYTPKKDEMVLTVHRWFAAKACPGDWLFSRLGDLAKEVTGRLADPDDGTRDLYRVQVGTFRDKAAAEKQATLLRKAGFPNVSIVKTRI